MTIGAFVLGVAAIIVTIGLAALAFASSIGRMSAKQDGFDAQLAAHAKASSERSDKLEARLDEVRDGMGEVRERVARIEAVVPHLRAVKP